MNFASIVCCFHVHAQLMSPVLFATNPYAARKDKMNHFDGRAVCNAIIPRCVLLRGMNACLAHDTALVSISVAEVYVKNA